MGKIEMVEVYIDGLCEPVNPGGIATYGYVIYLDSGEVVRDMGVAAVGGYATNNLAEYMSCIKAMEKLLALDLPSDTYITVYGDSQLLIYQLLGIYSVKSPRIIPLYNRAVEYIAMIRRRGWQISFRWIPREKNNVADELSRTAYRNFLIQHPEILERYRSAGYLATEKQIRSIQYLSRKLGREPPPNLQTLSRREASKLIGELLNQTAYGRVSLDNNR